MRRSPVVPMVTGHLAPPLVWRILMTQCLWRIPLWEWRQWHHHDIISHHGQLRLSILRLGCTLTLERSLEKYQVSLITSITALVMWIDWASATGRSSSIIFCANFFNKHVSVLLHVHDSVLLFCVTLILQKMVIFKQRAIHLDMKPCNNKPVIIVI